MRRMYINFVKLPSGLVMVKPCISAWKCFECLLSEEQTLKLEETLAAHKAEIQQLAPSPENKHHVYSILNIPYQSSFLTIHHSPMEYAEKLALVVPTYSKNVEFDLGRVEDHLLARTMTPEVDFEVAPAPSDDYDPLPWE